MITRSRAPKKIKMNISADSEFGDEAQHRDEIVTGEEMGMASNNPSKKETTEVSGTQIFKNAEPNGQSNNQYVRKSGCLGATASSRSNTILATSIPSY
ncbi:hypothetical protein Pcinc_004498 [Petrolisthes cinctipes]|uniref:Uncharacterized protein n=1 Tax=Petrolisthes cinctipes TaxID=88211 RepID=A0AAE1L3N5_PETCI|nr:hypothetical protein Pcinc_004498 [Petrolisthes cinctipes]